MKSIASVLIAVLLLTSAFAFSRPSSSSRFPKRRTTSSNLALMAKPNPVIKVAANAMSLLKPIFGLEATIQASILGAIANVNKDEVVAEIENLKRTYPVLIYTYALSPFSTEACALLDGANVQYKKIELGLEWFLLGGKASETRVALSKEVQNGATSLHKIFIGGECIGGCAELADLVESGELNEMLKRVQKVGTMKKSIFG